MGVKFMVVVNDRTMDLTAKEAESFFKVYDLVEKMSDDQRERVQDFIEQMIAKKGV